MNAFAYRRQKLSFMGRDDGEDTPGTVYYAVSLTTLALFSFGIGAPYMGALGFFCMAFGDGFAAVLGKRFGRRVLVGCCGKTLVGSATMLAVSFASCAVVLMAPPPFGAGGILGAPGGAFAPLWQFYAMLADVLAKKCVWHEQASQAVVSHDTALAKQLADGLTETIGAVEALRLAWLSLWNATNKPHGFEVIDGRLGGVAARLDTAQRRMRAFAAGECDTIPELAEPALPYTLLPDGTLDGSYRVGEILSACKIDG